MNSVFYEAAKDTSGKVFAERQHEFASRLHFHRAFELAYITRGSARYEIGDEHFVAQEGDIIFAHCYYEHRSFLDLPHEKIVVAVPKVLFGDIAALFSEKTLPARMRDGAFNRTLLPFFEALVEGQASSRLLQRGCVSLIFGALARRYEGERVVPRNRDVSRMVEVLDYLDRRFTEPLSLAEIAAHFGYNKSYFSRIFNSCVGVTLNTYINALRLNRFEALSGEAGEKSVTDRMLEAGFQSAATFYRAKAERNARGGLT